MKRFAVILTMLLGIGYLGSLAFANPAMLPKHPGYPASRDTSPVTNQPLANDPGQLSLSVEQASLEAASSEDAHVAQRLRAFQDNPMMERPDTGIENQPMQDKMRLPRSNEGK